MSLRVFAYGGGVQSTAALVLAAQGRIGSCPGGKTCKHRACWNPAHLDLASNEANILNGQSPPAQNARKEKCQEGHDYVTEADGTRRCPECRLARRVAAGETSGRGRPAERKRCPQDHPYDECGRESVRRRRAAQKQETGR
jgi:hypothetical protein